MPTLTTQKQFQEVQKLPFCYLCGAHFIDTDATNRDHVPPTAVFQKSDRQPALWLPTHVACNDKYSDRDEGMGQLVDLLHGTMPSDPRHRRLHIDATRGIVTNLAIDQAVHRWVRGMHSALYQEPLPYPLRIILTTPFAAFDPDTGFAVPIRDEHQLAVHEIKRNRIAGRLDGIISRNGKFVYECVWRKTGEGIWACAFALNLYDWKELGRTNRAPARGCAGFYFRDDLSHPPDAAIGTELHMPIANLDPLDPFAP